MAQGRALQAPGELQRQRSRSTVLLALAYLAIFGLFVVLRLSLIQPSSSEPWSDPDDYLRQAQLPLASLRFWAGPRVFGFPLLLKVFDNDQHAVVLAQLALAALCWGLCALAFAECLRVRWLRPLAFGLILGFSLTRDIVQWDFLIFSESLASSITALLIGLWCLILRSYETNAAPRYRGLLFGLLAIMTLYWSFIRDTNAYIVLGIAGAIGLALVGRWRRLPDRATYLGLALLFVAIFLAQNWTANQGQRWQFPLVNVLGQRILVDEGRTAFFAASGMPTDEKVMRYRDNFAHSHGNAIFRDADMAYFRDWLEARGKSTYLRFLLSRPGEALREPIAAYKTILRPPLGAYADEGGLRFPPWLLMLTGLLYIRAPEPIVALSLILLLALGLAALRAGRAVWLVPVLMALLVYPTMFLNWHGDAIEIGRHSYLVGVLLRLTFWMLICFVVDLAFSWVTERQRGRTFARGVEAKGYR